MLKEEKTILKYIKFLTIKAKYHVVEPHYMEGTTPDGPVVFSGSLYLIVFLTQDSYSFFLIHIHSLPNCQVCRRKRQE